MEWPNGRDQQNDHALGIRGLFHAGPSEYPEAHATAGKELLLFVWSWVLTSNSGTNKHPNWQILQRAEPKTVRKPYIFCPDSLYSNSLLYTIRNKGLIAYLFRKHAVIQEHAPNILMKTDA